MLSWDPHGMEWLNEIRETVVDTGLDILVKQAVAEVWRANRARHEPEELFDDAFTLSIVSSRNLANRLYATVNKDDDLRRAGVSATKDFATTVLHVGEFDLRLIKTPHLAARTPNFVSNFDWNVSESRFAAAARNHEAYAPSVRKPEITPLFEIERPNASGAVRSCRDVFIVWGAEFESGLTAGWLGLPTTTSDRWLAMAPLWWDGSSAGAMDVGTTNISVASVGFGDQPAPVPRVSLKSRKIARNPL